MSTKTRLAAIARAARLTTAPSFEEAEQARKRVMARVCLKLETAFGGDVPDWVTDLSAPAHLLLAGETPDRACRDEELLRAADRAAGVRPEEVAAAVDARLNRMLGGNRVDVP